MDKPSFRAVYQRGQLLLTLSFDTDHLIVDHLIVVRRWLPGTEAWTVLAGDDLHTDYSYPKTPVRDWVEANTDPLTAEITLAAFEDRMNQAIATVDSLREAHVPAHCMAAELDAARALTSHTALL